MEENLLNSEQPEEEIKTIVPFVVEESTLPYNPYFNFNSFGDFFDQNNELKVEVTNNTDRFLYNKLLTFNSKPCIMRLYINSSMRAVVYFSAVRRGTSFGMKPYELNKTSKLLIGAFTYGSINFNL